MARLRSTIRAAFGFDSTKTAEAAPRLIASMPSPPAPAKRSNTRAPITFSPRLEKIAAFTRSIVGRTPLRGTFNCKPPAVPAITLTAWAGPTVWVTPHLSYFCFYRDRYVHRCHHEYL